MSEQFPFRDQSLPMHERIEDLISRLTVEEKVFQLTNDAASVPRLGIREYNYWNEALHGVARAGVATVFPQAIGLAAMFNRPLMHKVASVVSDEGRAKYNEFQRQNDCGIYKGLTYWTPNVNLFRDPRWGRGHETYGEDPYLTGTLGVEFIRGLQGDDPHYLKSAACAKHFAVHSGPEQLRHEFNVDISDKELFETYLPAFEMCVKEGKVESVMGAYNAVNGQPCNCSTQLLSDILRKRWGFEGHVVSDCGAINDFHANHHFTANIQESAAAGVKGGCDLNCGGVYKHLLQSLKEGLIEECDLDVALRRVLRARFKLGMFDDPADVPYSELPFEIVASREHRGFNREIARRTMTLLKNDGILPLKRGVKIALVGPNADHKPVLLGNYNGTPSHSYTPLEGLRYYLGEDYPIGYAAGCRHIDFENPWEEGGRLNGAISVAERSDVIILCVGLDAGLEGEQGDAHNAYGSGDKPYLELPPSQKRLVEAMAATGKPLITVLLAGSAMAIGDADAVSNAVIDAYYPGEQGGIALAQILFGEESPAGRLPITFYKTTEELPPFEDYSMKGRTYRFMEQDALYPFGYGLSYTSFDYATDTTAVTATVGDTVTIPVTVSNVGHYDSWEVVQSYVAATYPGLALPKYELKFYDSVYIPQGEAATVTVELPAKAFSVIHEDGSRQVHAGTYTVYIGGQQPDARSRELTGKDVLALTVTLTGDDITLEN